MSYRDAERSVDPFAPPVPELNRTARGGLVLLGLLAIAATAPIGFGILVMLGGGHGSPFEPGPLIAWVMIVAFLAIPVLLLAFGITCLRTTNRRHLKHLSFIAAAIPACIVIGYTAMGFLLVRPTSSRSLQTWSPEVIPATGDLSK